MLAELAELPEPSEQQLLAEFEACYAHYHGRMLHAAAGMAPGLADIEDAVEDAFLDAWASWRRVRSAGELEAYLTGMVYNKLRDQMRKGLARDRVVGAAARFVSPVNQSSAEEVALGRVAAGELARNLRGLPPTQRKVMALTADGFGTDEIAQMLKIRTDTVRSHLRHARASLRPRTSEHRRRPS